MRIITDELVTGFKAKLLCEEKSMATVSKYVRDVLAFAKYATSHRIDKEVVLEYKGTLIRTYAPKSVNSMLSSLNSFFDYATWYDLKIKTIKIQRKIFEEKSRELTRQEYKRLLAAADLKQDGRLRFVIQTICSTGIRISELKYITVDAVYNQTAVINCKGKLRMIFIPVKLCRLLKSYIKQNNISSGPVFVTKFGKPLDRTNIWAEMKSLDVLSGVDRNKIYPHNLRHLFARAYYSQEKDIVRLADILGHSSIDTTRIYTIETGEEHRKQIERLHLV